MHFGELYVFQRNDAVGSVRWQSIGRIWERHGYAASQPDLAGQLRRWTRHRAPL